MKFGLDRALVCTYQAISGAGKTFETWPEMIDNVIPYIGGEEEKSEQEPMANILCARTRPKYIGGERAHYCEDEK